MTETQKNILIIAALVLTAAIALTATAVGIFALVSHKVYRRSSKATLITMFFRATRVKRIYEKSGYDKYMKKLDNTRCPRPKKLASAVAEHDFDGAKVYTLRKSDSSDKVILYLHGGAYIRPGTKYSWIACDKIVQATDATVIYPLYPLAPQNDHKKAYALLEKLYREIVRVTDKKIILMGDSAGGGLAFGFCELLDELGLPQPHKLITFSPWLDVTLANDGIADIERNDPMLARYGAVEIGKIWSGDFSPTDYRVSPLYGDVGGLDNVYIFGGTREILYPDIEKMHEKLISSGVNSTLFTGINMPHDYPLYPMPEAKKALDTVCEIISE